jgi:queuosine precursor transporter
VGQSVDSALFFPIAFWNSGLIPNELLLGIALTELVLKVLIEVVLTPVTYRIVAWLKRADHSDVYDRDTNFSPFRLSA